MSGSVKSRSFRLKEIDARSGKRCSHPARSIGGGLSEKGLKVGFVVALSDDPGDLDLLHYHHVRRMQHIGGLAKSHDQLRLLKKVLGSACHLWTATLDGEFAGALLTLQYRNGWSTSYPLPWRNTGADMFFSMTLEAMTKSAIQATDLELGRHMGHPAGHIVSNGNGVQQIIHMATSGLHKWLPLRGRIQAISARLSIVLCHAFSSAASPGQAPAMLPARNHA